jgi:hypothetical protein
MLSGLSASTSTALTLPSFVSAMICRARSMFLSPIVTSENMSWAASVLAATLPTAPQPPRTITFGMGNLLFYFNLPII